MIKGINARGLVWIGVGVLIHVLSIVLEKPFVLRFTSVPIGLVIVGIGVVILVYDVVRRKSD